MKFNFSWNYYNDLFIGIGVLIGKNNVGIVIFNLFIGFRNSEEK
jgi:hypothetical protein